MAVAGKSELISVLGEVKARVQDKLGIVDFPMPQFILIGKQSVGKSRLCEALAGEAFNFCSGTMGSRRPTVLEFRHVASSATSRWFVRSQTTNQWEQKPVGDVMKEVGAAHESLGADVSDKPVYVRLESANSVDMQIVDLPGFRDFADTPEKQALSDKIETLVQVFMRQKNNVMLCVEQAGDAAGMSTLSKCRGIDPSFERTILIRNKLDKYYSDLTQDNVNSWVHGYGDLPENLISFALTLPWWPDGQTIPKPFHELRAEKAQQDVKRMDELKISSKYVTTIGFNHFQNFMENKIESMFAEAINPVLSSLRNMREQTEKTTENLKQESIDTDPNRILSTTRDCGVSFATALTHVMEGLVDAKEGRMTLETELMEFYDYHKSLGRNDIDLMPNQDFSSPEVYFNYLRNEIKVGAFDVEINGGAQYRRLMTEAEIYLRFSEMEVEVKKRNVVQARGVSLMSLTWRDVVVKLLQDLAHLPLQRRLLYVGERLKWFFEKQKAAVIEFMGSLEGTPNAQLFSPLYPKHVKLIQQNEMIKNLVFQTYDDACRQSLKSFVELFDNMLTSTFSNPWVFLKGATPEEDESGELQDAVLPSFDDTKARVPKEIGSRSGVDKELSKWIQEIPDGNSTEDIDKATDKVQGLVMNTFSFIRSQVCDQFELFSESFFKLPMMRRLEESMSMIELAEQDREAAVARRERLVHEAAEADENLKEIKACIDRLESFKLLAESRGYSNLK